MKITRENFKNIVRETMIEENEYQNFFKKALEKTGKSIPDMSDEEKKAFFNKIDSAWKGRGEKNEGNAFGAAVSDAKEKGEDEFEVDGEKFKVESVNEDFKAVVGKKVYSDGKGKLFFGYEKEDDSVHLVDYKTWKNLTAKNLSNEFMANRLINAIVKGQKQFNKKVDYNMWSNKTKPSFEQRMDWFMKNGWISNINKGGIKESVESVNEGQLNVGDTITVQAGTTLQKMNGLDDKWKVIKKDNSTYTLRKVGSSMKVRHLQSKVDYLIARPGQSQLPFIVESVNEGIGTIALGVAGGLILLKILKFVLKKVVGSVGMNVKLPKEKLLEIVEQTIKTTLTKASGGGINVTEITALQSYLKDEINAGRITTIKQIVQVVDKVSKKDKNESVNEATLKQGTKLRYDKNNFVVDYVVDKKYTGTDGFPKYTLKVVKSNFPNKIKVGSTEEYEDSKLTGLIRNKVMNFVKNESVTESFADPLEGFPQSYKNLLKKLQRSNDRSERHMLINKMNVIRKKLKLKPLKNESVNEGKKRFKQQDGIGSSKYTISYHDGVKKNKDGSDFFDIKIFKNKPDLESFKKDLVSKGFVKESVNEEKYTVIDPKGNSLGTADKTQVFMAAKKKGGEKTGHFVVSAKNALKARRALEKFKGDFKNPKLKDMMAGLYESVKK